MPNPPRATAHHPSMMTPITTHHHPSRSRVWPWRCWTGCPPPPVPPRCTAATWRTACCWPSCATPATPGPPGGDQQEKGSLWAGLLNHCAGLQGGKRWPGYGQEGSGGGVVCCCTLEAQACRQRTLRGGCAAYAAELTRRISRHGGGCGPAFPAGARLQRSRCAASRGRQTPQASGMHTACPHPHQLAHTVTACFAACLSGCNAVLRSLPSW